MIDLEAVKRTEMKHAQDKIVEHHYLHRPVDPRCSVEAYHVILSIDTPNIRQDHAIGLLMFGRPEATRCGSWYGSVDDVKSGKCEVTRWQVLNLARVWLSPDVQPGGYLYDRKFLPGYTDRRGLWRSAVASTAIRRAVQQIGYDYLCRRPPCFLDEPYEIKYLMSYCDSKIHRGVIYRESGFELYRSNENQIQTWRTKLPPLEPWQHLWISQRSLESRRSQAYRNKRAVMLSQLHLPIIQEGGRKP